MREPDQVDLVAYLITFIFYNDYPQHECAVYVQAGLVPATNSSC